MSIQFDWAAVSSKDIVEQIRKQLNAAINSDEKADRVGSAHITELNLGTTAPDLEIEDLNELSKDKIKTSFAFYYQGDASITFYTRTELNPMVNKSAVADRCQFHMSLYDPHLSLTAPIYITLSNLHLDGKVVVTFEKPYLIVALKNEALKRVKVNSSFDGCAAAASVERSVRSKLEGAFQSFASKPFKIRIQGNNDNKDALANA